MIFPMFQKNTSPARVRRTRAPRYHLGLEGLEERTVMSVATLAHVAQPAAQIAAKATSSAANLSVPIQVTGINITGLTRNVQNGLVTGAVGTVAGTLAGQKFTAPITISSTSAANSKVPVLNLHLGPINLNLLGLEVKTSEICLNISAQKGPGNLLGNLLAGLANALNGTQSLSPTSGGTSLLKTLNGLLTPAGTATDVNTALNTLLTTALSGAKNTGSSTVLGVLNSGLSSALGKMAVSAPTSVQNILHLSVGPLNLNLLGLLVKLDNCNNGPVTVDVNAISGSGNLLGNLLASIAHLLDTPNLLANFDRAVLTAIGNAKV